MEVRAVVVGGVAVQAAVAAEAVPVGVEGDAHRSPKSAAGCIELA